MLKGTFRTLFVAAAISAPALIAPAMLTPAAAQVDMSLNIGVPLAVPFVEAVPAPRPGYLWNAGYWRWENNHRYWERGRWQEERHAERRGWNEHHYYR